MGRPKKSKTRPCGRLHARTPAEKTYCLNRKSCTLKKRKNGGHRCRSLKRRSRSRKKRRSKRRSRSKRSKSRKKRSKNRRSRSRIVSFRTKSGQRIRFKSKRKRAPAKSESELRRRMKGMHPKMVKAALKKWKNARK